MKLVLTYQFCRIAGHTSEEVREILAALETVYRELFPQLNLRRWGGSIYTWLTQPVLDPTNSGRVTMDYLMKLVTTALEWTYQAGETDVKAETLQAAASLLVLRRDTLRIIDGAGPSIEAPPSESTEQGNGSGTEPEQEAVPANRQQNTTETVVGSELRKALCSRKVDNYGTVCKMVPLNWIDNPYFRRSFPSLTGGYRHS